MTTSRPAAPPRAVSRANRVFLATATVLLIGANAAGAAYYRLPMAERVRSPMHLWLRPSGYVGQTAGILAVAIFVFLWLYPLRKKFRGLAWLGSVGKWLDVHITFALLMPLLLAVHAAWRFGGIIGLGFHAMMIVWASGIIGRYLYVRIPRSRSGLELTLEEIAASRRSMVTELAATTGIDPVALEKTLSGAASRRASPGLIRSFFGMIAADFTRWRIARELRRRWRHLPGRPPLGDRTLNAAVDLATREIALEQQVRLLQVTHRIFRYWHLAHRPIAVMALIAVVIHVAVVVAVGATWFW
jgi:hypothetical protein